MGMFDSLHTGWSCGQVKCLGNALNDFVPGDVVQLHVLPSGERLRQLCDQLAEYEAANPQVEIDELRVPPFDPSKGFWENFLQADSSVAEGWSPDDLSPGELDQLLKEVRTQDESHEEKFHPLGPLISGDASDVPSWHIVMDHGYATFLDGVFTSWDVRVEDDLPIVSNRGRPLEVKALDLGWSSRPVDCKVCAELRDIADVADE